MGDKKAKRGLGRGLSALMSDVTEASGTNDVSPKNPDRLVPIEQVEPNPDQPRRLFDQEKLDDLAQSIREKGIIQPLIVRPHPSKQDSFEIVAGERRWRAAQRAQIHEIPVIIRQFDDTETLEIAIIENIQRSDLNPVEEAAGYAQLMQRFGHTQDKLASALGKSRSHIANFVRLLSLPDEVQDLVRKGDLSSGHARALITSEDPVKLAQEIIRKGLSVRETENLVRQTTAPKIEKAPRSDEPASKDADTKLLEGDLTATLGMPVAVKHKPGNSGGVVSISYSDFDQLDDLCRILTSNQMEG
ncbi:MAG: ParB/RepB/Spo0J family partition protein [Pseudomonadota bacterium]